MSKGKEKLIELLKRSDFCMLTTISSNGTLVSRPLSTQKADFDGDLWYLIYDNSQKAKEISANPKVNVTFSAKNYWISISGTAKIIQNKTKAKELWSPFHKAWFPDGLETEHLAVLKVTADTAEYWDSPANPAVQLIGMVAAAVTGDEAKTGENKTITL